MKKNKAQVGMNDSDEVAKIYSNAQVLINKAMVSLAEESENTEPPSIEIEPSEFEKVKALQKEIFNIKFNYNALLNFTCQLLSHEQHVKFAAKKKEIFG